MPWKNKEDAVEWRNKNKQAKKDYDAARNNTSTVKAKVKQNKAQKTDVIRQYLISYLTSHPCTDCGETDIIVLEFDHIESKEIGISKAVNRGWSLKKIQNEIAKCVVRCANCHRRKTAKDFNWYKTCRGLVK